MRINCEQLSADWFAAKCGRIGASRVADAISYLKKGGESAARKTLKGVIVAETLTRIPQESYVSPAMEFGTQQEPFARALYEVTYGVSVEQVGMFVHPRINRASASPDGLIGDDGLIEIKCPNSSTHIDYILGHTEAPSEYQPQMLWQMACSERKWCDFCSYDPRMPAHLQLFVVRFFRDDAKIAAMEEEVTKFLAEVDDMLERLPKDDSPESIIAQAEAELVAKQVAEDMLLITKEDVCRHSQ